MEMLPLLEDLGSDAYSGSSSSGSRLMQTEDMYLLNCTVNK